MKQLERIMSEQSSTTKHLQENWSQKIQDVETSQKDIEEKLNGALSRAREDVRNLCNLSLKFSS